MRPLFGTAPFIGPQGAPFQVRGFDGGVSAGGYGDIYRESGHQPHDVWGIRLAITAVGLTELIYEIRASRGLIESRANALVGLSGADAGTGPGKTARWLSHFKMQMDAIDVSLEPLRLFEPAWASGSIRTGKRNHTVAIPHWDGANVHWHQADLITQQPPEMYDVVVAHGFFDPLGTRANVDAARRNLIDATRAGGFHIVASFGDLSDANMRDVQRAHRSWNFYLASPEEFLEQWCPSDEWEHCLFERFRYDKHQHGHIEHKHPDMTRMIAYRKINGWSLLEEVGRTLPATANFEGGSLAWKNWDRDHLALDPSLLTSSNRIVSAMSDLIIVQVEPELWTSAAREAFERQSAKFMQNPVNSRLVGTDSLLAALGSSHDVRTRFSTFAFRSRGDNRSDFAPLADATQAPGMERTLKAVIPELRASVATL